MKRIKRDELIEWLTSGKVKRVEMHDKRAIVIPTSKEEQPRCHLMNKLLDLVQLVEKHSNVTVEYVRSLQPDPNCTAPVTEVRLDLTNWHDYLFTRKLKSIELVPDYKSKYFRAVASLDFEDGSNANVTLNSQEHTHEFILLMETL